MKLGQLIEYRKINTFFKSYPEDQAGKIVPDLFLFFKKVQYELKAGGLQLSFNIFQQTSTWHRIKT